MFCKVCKWRLERYKVIWKQHVRSHISHNLSWFHRLFMYWKFSILLSSLFQRRLLLLCPFHVRLELIDNMMSRGAARAGFFVRVTEELARQCLHWSGHGPVVSEEQSRSGHGGLTQTTRPLGQSEKRLWCLWVHPASSSSLYNEPRKSTSQHRGGSQTASSELHLPLGATVKQLFFSSLWTLHEQIQWAGK